MLVIFLTSMIGGIVYPFLSMMVAGLFILLCK